jgi:hypothetical protein
MLLPWIDNFGHEFVFTRFVPETCRSFLDSYILTTAELKGACRFAPPGAGPTVNGPAETTATTNPPRNPARPDVNQFRL